MKGIDTMSETDFKLFVEKLFCRLDHDKIKRIDITPGTSDQGCDLIINYKNGVILGIHCTCIAQKVDTDAVQNIVKAKVTYKLTDLMIVTNNSFTKSAIDKAKVYKVKLVNREILLKMLQLYRNIKPNSKAVL